MNIWKQYVWNRQTATDLANKFNKSARWIQKQLDLTAVSEVRLNPEPLVIVGDATFFSRTDGVIVIRSPRLKKNLWWQSINSETPAAYLEARQCLERRGFQLQAVVLDGKRGVKAIFKDIPTQMCHFHQLQIIKRYLTSRPKLPAGKELRAIALTLTKSNEINFTDDLVRWHQKWQNFLKEKSFRDDRQCWFYTHKRIRSAYRSLTTNLPHLFTYLKYPNLEIPNTTNCLDGYFNRLKHLLSVHRGTIRKRRDKIIHEILKI